MEKITIIGTGTMGHSIALSIAWADLPVTIYALNDNESEGALLGIKEKAAVLIENKVLNESEFHKLQQHIHVTKDLKAATKDATIIIEAAPENLQLKQTLLQEIETYCAVDTIIASNSSSLQPTRIAEKVSHPERVLGTHFWNPAHLIPLVEIIRGEKTTDVYLNRIQSFLKRIHKQPIVVQKEVTGFVGNRLQFALFREAQYLYESGVASLEDIDRAVELSIGRRLGVTGPFMTADLGGLDVFKAISDYTFPDLANHTAAFDTMNERVDANHLGEKTGQGYYDWPEESSTAIKQAREAELIRWLKRDQE